MNHCMVAHAAAWDATARLNLPLHWVLELMAKCWVLYRQLCRCCACWAQSVQDVSLQAAREKKGFAWHMARLNSCKMITVQHFWPVRIQPRATCILTPVLPAGQANVPSCGSAASLNCVEAGMSAKSRYTTLGSITRFFIVQVLRLSNARTFGQSTSASSLDMLVLLQAHRLSPAMRLVGDGPRPVHWPQNMNMHTTARRPGRCMVRPGS